MCRDEVHEDSTCDEFQEMKIEHVNAERLFIEFMRKSVFLDAHDGGQQFS